MLQLFVNGPPGAGKTSLCKLLCEEFGLELVATGDLLRENILHKTPLGLVAKDCISRKSLVPDHVVVDMVAEKICECVHGAHAGWVLDGFPRTAEQSAALRRKQIYPSVVVVLELSERECVQRITGRRFDPVTSKIYHMPSIMPRESGVLARLTKRSDDAADRLPPRFEAYRQHGEATNALYDGVLHRVEAAHRKPQEILDTVVQLLHAHRRTHASGNSHGHGVSRAGAGNAALSSHGNQAMPPPLLPIKHTSASVSAMAASGLPASSKRPQPHQHHQHQHHVPQKIEEEDEEQVAQETQGELCGDSSMFKFAPEHRHALASATAPSSATALTAATASQRPVSHSVSPYDDELPRLHVDFQTMHRQVTQEFGSAAASPSTSPSASPSSASSKAKALESEPAPASKTTTPATAGASNNEEPGQCVSSRSLGPVTAAPAATSAPLPMRSSASAAQPPPSSSSNINGVDMHKFKDVLLDGFDVLKHGRRGSPHARTIFTDMELKRIFWMKPGKEAKAKKAKLDQSLLLADVVQVVRGMKTEVLKRSGDVAKYERYLSLVADDRTLDLELPSEAMCEFLLRGFEQLLHGSS